jgi:hypothetical protein
MKSGINAWLTAAALGLTALALPLGCGMAAKKPTAEAAGTWKLAANTNSQTGFQQTLKIRRAGGRLAGTLSHTANARVEERVLEDVKLQGSELFFTVTIPPASGSGPGFTRRYRGEISGDAIKGKCDIQWAGQPYTRDWEAKRVRE